MIELNKRYRLDCTLIEGSITEMRQFPDRMKGCYQLEVFPWEPYIKHELDQVIKLGAGPYASIDNSEIYGVKDSLILETVIKPYQPDFLEEGDPAPSTSLRVTIFPELKFSTDGEFCYPQLTIVGVDKYVDPCFEETTELDDDRINYDW